MTDTPLAAEDEGEFTEIRDAVFTNVDAVGAAANGTRWFFAKQAAEGLVPSELVRELIGEDQAPAAPNVVGPAARIHGAPVRKSEPAPGTEPEDYAQLIKAKYDTEDRKRMAGNGQAMDDGSYPIADGEDLDKAIRAVGRGGADHDAIRRHIISRAKSLGQSSKIPDDWSADGSLKGDDVAKADETETAAEAASDLDVTEVMAEPAAGAGGSPEMPGSPAWEATDAATARKWSAILARAKVALETLSDREALEAATADPSDIEDAWDLADAACAIEYALGILAPFAIGEQLAAEGAGEMAAIGKAIAEMDPDAADVVSFLAAHGARTPLSEPNAQAMREAAAALRKGVDSLPRQAPPEPEAPQGPVEKAGNKPQVAVYDAHGCLVGVVDRDAITQVTQMTAEDTGDEMTEPQEKEPEGATTTADAALIPGTSTVASPPKAEQDDEKVTKAVQAAVAPLAEAVAELAKQVSHGADTAGAIDVLKARIDELAKMPDTRNRPLVNGATGTPGMAARAGALEDPYAELTKAVESAKTPGERLAAAQELAYARVRDRFKRD